MLQTVKNFVHARKERSLLGEALKAHQLIQEAEDCGHFEDCAHFLRQYLRLAKDSQQKEIYAPEDAQAILVGKLYQQTGSTDRTFKQELEVLIDDHQKILAEFGVAAEEAHNLMITAKQEEYAARFTETISQLEETLQKGENNIILAENYDVLKRQISYHLRYGEEINLSVTQIMPDGTEHELDADEHVYSLAVQIGINNLAKHIDNLPAEEIATDNFQEHYERVLGQIADYAGRIDLDQEKTARLQKLQYKFSVKVESVQEGIVKKQDQLYRKAEFASDNVQELFDGAFREFARHSLQYQRILEDSPEDIQRLYNRLTQ